MIRALEVVTILLAAVVVSLTLAHALELPGKMRLPREIYLATQAIYYPGFTIGGIAEPLTPIALLVLLLSMPAGSMRFWLTLLALIAFAAVHIVFWIWVQPINKIWLKDINLGKASAAFFGTKAEAEPAIDGNHETPDWKALRNQWEFGHVIRAGLAMIGLALLAIAVTN
jgi:Domain of unknown function (DUF1772)